jgi:hypothetical protein
MITAEEARHIVGPTPKELEIQLEDIIRSSARNRSYDVLVGIHPFSQWLLESYDMNPHEEQVLAKMINNGFFLSNDGFGLRISWEFPIE